eukprot:366126-Chlamydomonas_euryale.AAC.12
MGRRLHAPWRCGTRHHRPVARLSPRTDGQLMLISPCPLTPVAGRQSTGQLPQPWQAHAMGDLAATALRCVAPLICIPIIRAITRVTSKRTRGGSEARQADNRVRGIRGDSHPGHSVVAAVGEGWDCAIGDAAAWWRSHGGQRGIHS